MSLGEISTNYESDVENDIQIDEDISNIDFENIGLIPCELCETMINFEDYEAHMMDCIRNQNLRRQRFDILNSFMNILNSQELMNRVNNTNVTRTPRDAENMNETADNDEYNEENDIRDENPGNVNTVEVNNIEVNSDDEDVVIDDNAVNIGEPIVKVKSNNKILSIFFCVRPKIICVIV